MKNELVKELLNDNLFDNHKFKGWDNLFKVSDILEKHIPNFSVVSREDMSDSLIKKVYNKGSDYYYIFYDYVSDLQKDTFGYLIADILFDSYYEDKNIYKTCSLYPSEHIRGLEIQMCDFIENGTIAFDENANVLEIEEVLYLSSFEDIVEVFEKFNFSENMSHTEIRDIFIKIKKEIDIIKKENSN